ncbi:hypothetical protein WN944_006350 [Citrus x changshan-huyou]|uniref:Uncharacterized protein n=1 Tax=Citrus x changshan-huyou TaxID=2935761 RepID=A0AAP0MJ07_9ROSI
MVDIALKNCRRWLISTMRTAAEGIHRLGNGTLHPHFSLISLARIAGDGTLRPHFSLISPTRSMGEGMHCPGNGTLPQISR